MNAVAELIAASRALLNDAYEVAKNSHAEHRGPGLFFDDALWQKAEPEQFAIVARLRAAIAAAEAMPSARTPAVRRRTRRGLEGSE